MDLRTVRDSLQSRGVQKIESELHSSEKVSEEEWEISLAKT